MKSKRLLDKLRLCPTGDFPEGKLNRHDEGGLRFAISAEKGHVRIDFGKPVAWVALPPDTARKLAESLNRYADLAVS